MRVKDMAKAELELLSNCDLTTLLLKENKKPMNTAMMFKEICSLLDYTEEEYSEKNWGILYFINNWQKIYIVRDSWMGFKEITTLSKSVSMMTMMKKLK